jgi:molecular chaperone DnaK (HSP70)
LEELELSEPKYIIGVDLGTTHCVLAYTETRPADDEQIQIEIFPVPQVVHPGDVRPQPLLPSFLFLPGPHDIPPGGLALPWDPDSDLAVGEFARQRGAELPDRLVSSAKSWLCHTGVDRTAPILPWESGPEIRKVSPVEASASYLKHMRDAWNFELGDKTGARFEEQQIYLTVPASFDALARELTMRAAQSAGLEKITLIEEPQAAFYAWIYQEEESWRKQVHVGESVLVCDVGGGTTDFSLIQVTEETGELSLRRVAVGDHLLLGGDNMDLTLAYAVRAKLSQKGINLDTWQFRALWYGSRIAKERLLSDPNLASEPVVVLGRGSSLIGGSIRTELTRAEVEDSLLDGFFPACESNEYPKEKPRVGMREMGLPYEPDPAVTRHLARFLDRQARNVQSEEGEVPFPSAVLFNGGVMKAGMIRRRVLTVMNGWEEARKMREIKSADLDLAVARGAAYYGLARLGRGVRIRAGAARSYYIGIESALPSVPGFQTPMKALCVVPHGMEEGTEAEIRKKEFGLVVGEPAVFHLLASTIRKKDQAGEIVEDWRGEIEEVSTMEILLLARSSEEKGDIVPVWLESRITEIGTLELWCVSRDETQRWKLEFNLRDRESAS